jgi:two-component system sensor histidine kinase UhpB
LRPAELDELGLAASLNSLILGWNTHCDGKVRFRLTISGEHSLLTEPLAITLFRITQECLTNIAKHSAASNVNVMLAITSESAELIVEDDGNATKLPFADISGIGLLGIRERITALDGRLSLAIVNPHGLIVKVWLPILVITETCT